MALTLEEKKAVVADVAKAAAGAHSAVAVEYRGLTVDELTGLRVKARNENVYLRVVKNSLARRAIEGTDFECMSDGLTGPLMLAFSQEDPRCRRAHFARVCQRQRQDGHAQWRSRWATAECC